jgi:hypothetical protein
VSQVVVTVVQSQPVVVTEYTPQVHVAQSMPVVEQVVSPDPGVTEVEVDPNALSVVEVQTQGTQGPPGVSAQDDITRTAAEILGGHRVVRAVSATHCEYADQSNPLHGDDTLGVTLNAAALGDLVTIRTEGSLTHAGWSWTAGLPVFLSTLGGLTQVEPSSGCIQVIGFAEAADTLFIDPQPAIYY